MAQLVEQRRVRLFGARLRAEADAAHAARHAPIDDRTQALERAAADEQHLAGVDLQELLVRMLASALRRHGGDGALDDLEQRLLHALAGDIAGDRGVVGLARNLVDFVDVDDAALGAGDVEIRRLNQVQQDVLNVLAYVAGLGQRGRVGDREGDVEDARERGGEQRLADTGRSDQQDVALLEFNAVGGVDLARDPLVVVVDGDGEHALGVLLADDVIAEPLVDRLRRQDLFRLLRLGSARRLLLFDVARFLADHVATGLDAFVADVDPAGSGDQPPHVALVFGAERAVILRVAAATGHRHSTVLSELGPFRRFGSRDRWRDARCYAPAAAAASPPASVVSTSSTRPYSLAWSASR